MTTTCSCCSSNFKKLKKGLWSPEEDERLKNFITENGIVKWSEVPILAGLERCGKSCRQRWLNYLRPGIKRGKFTPEEQRLVCELQSVYGNRWSWIAKHMPGRTDNEIKNLWNAKLRKKMDLGENHSAMLAFCEESKVENLQHGSIMSENATPDYDPVSEPFSDADWNLLLQPDSLPYLGIF